MKKTLYIVLFFFFSLTSVRAQSPNYVINYNKVNGYNVDAEEFTTDETELFESTDDTVLRLGMGVSVLNDEYVFMFEPFGVAENLNLTLIKKSMREKSQEYSIHPITITLSNGSKIYWEKCLFWDVMQKENINNLPAIFNLPEVCVFSIYARSTPIDVYTRSEIESSVVIENLMRYNISSIQLGDDLFSNTENLQTKEIFQAIASAMREKGYKVSSEKSGSSTITSSITKNGLIGNEWKEKLSSIMDYVTDIYNNGDSYKGIKSGGKRNGFGIYKWKSGTYFLGYFGDGHYRNGILFSGDKYNSNCPGCVFFMAVLMKKGRKTDLDFVSIKMEIYCIVANLKQINLLEIIKILQ